FPVGFRYRNGSWESAADNVCSVMGPVTRVTQPSENRAAMIGVYLRPGGASALIDVPAAELSDSVIPLDCLWPSEIPAEPSSLDAIETLLVRRLARGRARDQARR